MLLEDSRTLESSLILENTGSMGWPVKKKGVGVECSLDCPCIFNMDRFSKGIALTVEDIDPNLGTTGVHNSPPSPPALQPFLGLDWVRVVKKPWQRLTVFIYFCLVCPLRKEDKSWDRILSEGILFGRVRNLLRKVECRYNKKWILVMVIRINRTETGRGRCRFWVLLVTKGLRAWRWTGV